MKRRKAAGLTSLCMLGLVTACGGGGGEDRNIKPAYLGAVSNVAYDGVSDDLLTAGLGASGIAGAAPTFADAANPTATELRRSAIYNNYRALIDPTAAGGYGVLYGPNVANDGSLMAGEGRIAGDELIAFSDDGTGRRNVTMMVQIPANFDTANPCIVTATSSGSRGVYGAIGTAGDWGLKQGCAVAYSDKGSGIGYHNLENNTVNLIDGRRSPATTAGNASHFTANLSDTQRAAFTAQFPNRVAVKQAHSEQNSERDWGTYTLQAIEFAFWALNQKYGQVSTASGARLRTFRPENTVVIASSVSNGGGAAILAAEQDTNGLIDGVAVSEPVTEVALPTGVTIERGGAPVASSALHLFDTMTIGNLYQPCAARAILGDTRCTALAARGLVNGATAAEQGADALARLRAAGWEAESDPLHWSHYSSSALLAAFYANMYGRFSVTDNVCGYSLGAATPISAANEATWFGAGNGLTGAGFGLMNNGSGAADTQANLDGAICLRNLATGTDIETGAPLSGQMATWSNRVRTGMDEVLRNGNLRGKPAIIVHGRADALIPVNHNSRAYFARNKAVEGSSSRLSYIEVENAHHFDLFNGLGLGYDALYIPIHVYHIRAMNAMWAHLKNGTALPPSQVVRTTPRGGTPNAAPAISAANVPAISASPAAGNQINFAANTASIPN